ncbi:FAD-dependent oxidoreductase [Kineosporia babensis]|uniref:FAD-dependent oxidoreductase n=1 Tax=Kineosporia babensis TaxID=499548 RepID=A0A9X1NL07_9ACTN|nr:FAD-dependent oxidoreductase [Kineosporia babensis]MCD5316040.1 FAD-dependent oxidoreductase [Kineosporia babensis]
MSSGSVLVVGGGLAGASAAWRLAARGMDVTLLERHVPATEHGSSHGSARIFRFPYPQELYVSLVKDSEAGWAELSELHGSPLITPTGALDFGAERDPHGLAEVLAKLEVEHELLSPEAAQQRWPQITFDSDVLFHPGGGVLDAENTVRAMVSAAQALGARVLTGWPVQRLERTSKGFRAVADDGRAVEAGRVVVSAGGWLPELLGRLDLPSAFVKAFPDLEVREENAFHFPYRSPEDVWPTLIHKRSDICVYALPGGRDAGFRGQKVAEYNAGKVISSASGKTGVIDPANRRRVVDYVRRYLPGLEPEPYAETTCLFTNTPTEDFVIDGMDGVTVLSACSGHGAKFAPVLGELAADVVLGTAEMPREFRVLN